jgi:hypothetical protein
MLVGHYAVGFLGKQLAPRVPLAALMIATMFPDLLTFVLQLAGIEHAGLTPGFPRYFGLNAHDTAISHSLAMDVVWAIAFASVYFTWRSDTRGATALAAAVLSHWLFDVITHRPDMPLAPLVDVKLGLTLWDSVVATFVVEGGLWALAIGTYMRATQPTAAPGKYWLWLLVGPLTMWFIATPFAPTPAGDFTPLSLTVLLIVHVAAVSLAYWVDRNRAGRSWRPQELGATLGDRTIAYDDRLSRPE